jgi:succinate-semialdehyde dehydrogenase / glutarate-semialdehyde dehydrogenase
LRQQPSESLENIVSSRLEVSSVDPHDGLEIGRYRLDDEARTDATLSRAWAAQRRWRAASFAHRADVLRAFAVELKKSRDELAEMVTAEMGKTLREARAEVEKSAWACDYYAEHGPSHLAPTEVETDFQQSYVQFPPLGVVLAVMPWNYPVWQVMRAAAPALMAGNTVVLKHASNVTGSALLLSETLRRVEESLLEVVVVPGSGVASLIADERIAAVTLTGSEAAGVSVAQACAQALKPSVLELGGSDPFIVLHDADVLTAARVGVKARFSNTGQSCVAAKRFIVVETVADAFEEAFANEAAALRQGPPREDVDLGPMSRADLRDELADQVTRGVTAGGRLLLGGVVPDGPGAYFPPTVVGGVEPGNPLADEETFGPAAAILRAPDTAAAIEIANNSPYGLSSSLWTSNLDYARSLAGAIEAGAVFINAMTASDPRMPFGGIKRSGWGRELGAFGIREFVNVQAISLAHPTGR